MKKEQEINYAEKIKHAVQYILGQTSLLPKTGIIIGTGLGSVANDINVEIEIPYDNIPFFPLSTVESHHGKLIFGKLGNKTVVAMKGRFHYYEGYSMKEVTFPIRVMKRLGIENLIVSNASGGLDPDYKVGELMVIEDHIDLFPENPLRGKNMDEFGVRFPDMSAPYDPILIKKAMEFAAANGKRVHSGVYAGVQGPNLDTRAEYKYLHTIGADAVGMSTIPEVIVAVHCALRVFAISAITDLGSPGNIKKISIKDVLTAAAKAEPEMRQIILEILKHL